MNPTLRLSYSLATLWSKGLWDDAVGQFFGLKDITTPQMQMGKEYHEKTAAYIKKMRSLPEYLGGAPLYGDIGIEEKYIVKVEPCLELSFVLDLEELDCIAEHKFGKTPAGIWADNYQLPIYNMALRLATGRSKTHGKVRRHNPATGEHDMALVWFSEELEQSAINWFTTIAAEMHNYFTTNDFYNKYGKERLRMLEKRGEERGLYVDISEND